MTDTRMRDWIAARLREAGVDGPGAAAGAIVDLTGQPSRHQLQYETDPEDVADQPDEGWAAQAFVRRVLDEDPDEFERLNGMDQSTYLQSWASATPAQQAAAMEAAGYPPLLDPVSWTDLPIEVEVDHLQNYFDRRVEEGRDARERPSD